MTFRTATSISHVELQSLHLSRFTPDLKRKQILAQLERWLDEHPETGFLHSHIAAIVADAIRFRNGREYDLLAFCVMPNHVHMLFTLKSGMNLAAVMRKLKSYTATQINQALKKGGPVWQREYFDRLVRPGTLGRFVNYIVQNPRRALLTGWAFAEDCRPPS
ncbi:MAG: transposase [Acidobacteriaceae bacterium]